MKNIQFSELDLARLFSMVDEVNDKHPSARLVRQYRAEKLVKLLRDGVKIVDLEWYIDELHKLRKDPTCPHSVRKAVLDEFRNLALLAVIQHPDVRSALAKVTDSAKPLKDHVDPFVGKLKLRKTGTEEE